jgi:hypothetical protein
VDDRRILQAQKQPQKQARSNQVQWRRHQASLWWLQSYGFVGGVVSIRGRNTGGRERGGDGSADTSASEPLL